MTRRCSWCLKTLGEKCPKCGGTELLTLGHVGTLEEIAPTGARLENAAKQTDREPTGRTVPDPRSQRVYKCLARGCGKRFLEGDGGITHALCDDCAQRQRGPLFAGRPEKEEKP